MAFHTVKHHQTYRSNDCTSTLMGKLLAHSSISKKYSCARTKVEAIVNSVLALMTVQYALNNIQKHGIMYIGVATDSSPHKSTKFFPIVIQYFDWKNAAFSLNCLKSNTTKETSSTIAIEVKQTDKNGLD